LGGGVCTSLLVGGERTKTFRCTPFSICEGPPGDPGTRTRCVQHSRVRNLHFAVSGASASIMQWPYFDPPGAKSPVPQSKPMHAGLKAIDSNARRGHALLHNADPTDAEERSPLLTEKVAEHGERGRLATIAVSTTASNPYSHAAPRVPASLLRRPPVGGEGFGPATAVSGNSKA
jgi:hypothetical protein